ncbi:hypothetical protein D3C73_1354660 [compost metagenome]
MFVEFEMTVQQVALGRIGVTEQHHLGIQSLDGLQRSTAQLKTLDHRCFTRPGRDV